MISRSNHVYQYGIVSSLLLVLLFPACGQPDGLTVENAWARPTTGIDGGGGGRAAVYMKLSNSGQQTLRVTAVSTEIAETAELHESVTFGGVAKMRPVDSGIAVPAGGEVSLSPGGYHIMVIGLSKPLSEGDSFSVVIEYEVDQIGHSLTVPVAVETR